MHEYVREWWENKASNNDDSVWNDYHNREFLKNMIKNNWSKSVEEREDLKNCKNFAFVYPTIGRKNV